MGIKDLAEGTKKVAEVLPAIESILEFVKRRWLAVTAALCIGAVYSIAWYVAFRSPQEMVKGFLSDITDHRLQSAWERLHPNFRQSRWAGDFSEFSAGYTSTSSDTFVEASTEGESWLPNKVAGAFFSNALDVTVLSRATDDLDGKECAVGAPPTICLIAQMVEPITYRAVVAGDDFPLKSIGDRRKMMQVSRTLQSRYTIRRDGVRGNWTIIDIHLNEIRIPM